MGFLWVINCILIFTLEWFYCIFWHKATFSSRIWWTWEDSTEEDDKRIFPDLSLTKDFFREMTAEKGDNSNLKLRFEFLTWFRRFSKDLEASIAIFSKSGLKDLALSVYFCFNLFRCLMASHQNSSSISSFKPLSSSYPS